MFVILLLVSLLTSVVISVAVIAAFSRPMNAILYRIIADAISAAWLKYMKFAILVVGISSGVRIREFEQYLAPARWDRSAHAADLTAERWLLELYRTAIETLQGIAWMLLVFFMFALLAFVIVRFTERRFGAARPGEADDVA
ncbi:MAG TPA: hypothetical protein VN361_11570 [Oxalicibacterium sp.]|nr:hypothetical protein [Oxalicibacterium sp.]